MDSDFLITQAEMVGGTAMNRKFLETAAWLGVGVALYLTLTNTVGSLLNPLLSSLKLSATPT